MIDLTTIVWFVFVAIIAILILGLLWYAIDYAEKKALGPPMAWTILRIIFVLLCVFLLIGVLLSFIGQPIVRWR